MEAHGPWLAGLPLRTGGCPCHDGIVQSVGLHAPFPSSSGCAITRHDRLHRRLMGLWVGWSAGQAHPGGRRGACLRRWGSTGRWLRTSRARIGQPRWGSTGSRGCGWTCLRRWCSTGRWLRPGRTRIGQPRWSSTGSRGCGWTCLRRWGGTGRWLRPPWPGPLRGVKALGSPTAKGEDDRQQTPLKASHTPLMKGFPERSR